MQKTLVDILHEKAGLAKEALGEVRLAQSEKGGSIGDILIKKKMLTETQWLGILSDLYDLPVLQQLPVGSTRSLVIQNIPIQFLKKYVMVPLENEMPGAPAGKDGIHDAEKPPAVLIAVNDPTQFQPIDDLIRIIGMENVTARALDPGSDPVRHQHLL